MATKSNQKERGEADAAEVLGAEVAKVGNLTREPELRTAKSGTPYAVFGIAVERPVVEGDWHGQRETIFYDVVCFGTVAGNAAASLKEGTRVIIVGRTETRAYETGDGEIRDVVRIVANAVGPELRWATATVRKVRVPARRRPRRKASGS
jgi:single-strand DNA-binding protein